jgi:hypothetical protein
MGLVLLEHSSGNRRRLGQITKQGRAGGSGTSDGAQRARVAQQVFSPDDEEDERLPSSRWPANWQFASTG